MDTQDKLYWVKTLDQYMNQESGQLIAGDALADFLVTKHIIDISSLLPISLSERGWISGLQGIKVTSSSRGYRNLMDTVEFGTPPKVLMPRLNTKAVKDRAEAQLRQRKLVIKALNLSDRDSFEMESWLNESPDKPWCNSYDVSGLPGSYETLYGMLVHQVTFSKAVSVAKVPISKQLAFPAKAFRWTSNSEALIRMSPEREWSYELYDNKFSASIDKAYFADLSVYEEPFDYPITMEERQEKEELDDSMDDQETKEENISLIISEYPVADIYALNISHSTQIPVEVTEHLDAATTKKLLDTPV